MLLCEPLEQDAPVAESIVERLLVGRLGELDAVAARGVRDPGAPEWSRVAEHGVEVDRERHHAKRLVVARPIA